MCAGVHVHATRVAFPSSSAYIHSARETLPHQLFASCYCLYSTRLNIIKYRLLKFFNFRFPSFISVARGTRIYRFEHDTEEYLFELGNFEVFR